MKNKPLFSSNLEYFTVVYRQLNYGEAAKAIPMTPQGLRKAINQLESSIGAKLFVSSAEGALTATSAAEELSELIKRWINDTRVLESTLNQLREDGKKFIRLAMCNGSPGYLGYDLKADFSKTLPGYNLEIYEQTDFMIEDALMDGIYDLAISSKPRDNILRYFPLASVESCVWVHRDNPLASRKSLALQDLNGHPVSLTGVGNKAGTFFIQAFEEYDIVPNPLVINTEFFWNYLFAVENRGLGLGMWHIGRILSEIDNVVAIPLKDGYVWQLGILHRRDYELSDLEQRVIGFLTKRARHIEAKLKV